MALAQTEEIARRLAAAAPGLDLEIVKFETTGVVCSSKHRVPDLPKSRAVGLELLQKGAAASSSAVGRFDCREAQLLYARTRFSICST
jgi:hypothetical protein